MNKRIIALFIAVIMILGIVPNVFAVSTEAEITEDEFWDVYDAVVDLTYSGIPLTQERIDAVRAQVDGLPDGTDFYGMTKQTFTATLDFIQREFDEGNIVPDPDPDPEAGLFKVIDGGGEYNGEGYSIKIEEIDVRDGDIFQFRYLKFGTTWSEWSTEKPFFTDVKAGQDKYKIEVRLMMGGTTELEKQTGYVEITPKPVTITVHDQEKFFGEDDPEITYAVDGVLETSELVLIRTHRYSQVVNDELTEADQQVGFYQARLVATFVHNPNYKVKVILGDFTIKGLSEGIATLTKIVEGKNIPVGQIFTFTVMSGPVGEGTVFELEAGETYESPVIPFGTYVIKETAVEGYNDGESREFTLVFDAEDNSLKITNFYKEPVVEPEPEEPYVPPYTPEPEPVKPEKPTRPEPVTLNLYKKFINDFDGISKEGFTFELWQNDSRVEGPFETNINGFIEFKGIKQGKYEVREILTEQQKEIFEIEKEPIFIYVGSAGMNTTIYNTVKDKEELPPVIEPEPELPLVIEPEPELPPFVVPKPQPTLPKTGAASTIAMSSFGTLLLAAGLWLQRKKK